MNPTAEHILSDLIALLYRDSKPEEFAICLAQAEAMGHSSAAGSGVVELVRMAMAIRNRLELQQQSEQGMLAVVESAKDLSGRLDLTELLRTIVIRARNLLGAQLTWLTMYDADRDQFRVLVSDGAISGNTSRMTVGRNFGVAGIVMTSRLPFSTADYLHDNRFAHDSVLDDTFRAEGIEALVGVPLLSDDEFIGLLFVADRYHRTHTALNISILCTLATHAAVAINNAKAFERANAAFKNAEQARVQLERHVRKVQSAAEAHEQLTSLLAKGASLGTICQCVAQLLSGSVLVVDEAGEVISRGTMPGYVGTAAEHYLPHAEYSGAIRQALHESRLGGRSVIAYKVGDELCRIVAVIAGNEVLGAVLLFRLGDLDDTAVRTFERCSGIIGIVLLSQERMEATRNRDVSALVRTLVTPRQDEPALTSERATRFGLDLMQPISVMLIEIDELKPAFIARRLRVRPPFSEVLLDDVDGVLVVICGAAQAQGLQAELRSRAEREFGMKYRGVVSRPVRVAAEVPAMYGTLRRSLLVLGRIGIHGKIVAQDELALYAVLFETHDQASLKRFLDITIGGLIAQDSKRGSELTYTLLSYFDSNQNATTTAARLGIHVNTVRQRLAAIEELLGYWGSANRALEVHMALRLWSLSAGDR